MSYTLSLVQCINWVVIEDSTNKTDLVSNLLKQSGLLYTHLTASTEKNATRDSSGKFVQRGLIQRNTGLDWIRRDPFSRDLSGVVYFGDDDNTYSLQIFEEMRYTRKVSVWPVGLLSDQGFETPIVQSGKVVGWFAWNPHRQFAVDMCGFAVSVALIVDTPKAVFAPSNTPGVLETNFISSLGVGMDDLEPRAKQCTKILVWHTKTLIPVQLKPKNFLNNVFIKKGVQDRDGLIESLRSDSYNKI